MKLRTNKQFVVNILFRITAFHTKLPIILRNIFTIFLVLHLSGFTSLDNPLFNIDHDCVCSIDGQEGHNPNCNCACGNKNKSADKNAKGNCHSYLFAQDDTGDKKVHSNDSGYLNKSGIAPIPCHGEKKSAIMSGIDNDKLGQVLYLALDPTLEWAQFLPLNNKKLDNNYFQIPERPS